MAARLHRAALTFTLAYTEQGHDSMDMTGERRIAAPRQAVWDGLNDTDILKASIPGCERLEKTGDNQMKAVAAVKLGPISARFNGAVTLSDIDAPNSYTIMGEGQGGVAGFAKGGAKVFLTDGDNGDTMLKYAVHAQVGGKLAQLGARLIDATAKQMAEQFFTKFSGEVERPFIHEAVPEAIAVAPPPPSAMHSHAAPPSAVSMLDLVPREPFGLPVAAWIGMAVFTVMVLLWLASIF
jgi:carbon monoxide dehydrogenase subunit G